MDMQFSGVFWKIYDAALLCPRYISNKGGTRSTKTYSTLQFLHLLIPRVDKAGDITSVVSETIPHLKKGAVRDFENIIGHSLKGDPHWNATDMVWTYDNGAKLEFFSCDNASKVHGSQRKRLFVNEANHIEFEIFRQMAVRTSSIIFIDYNPASVCWIQKNIECKDNCILIRSTYKDNPFLSAQQILEIEDNKSDANWWKVYGEGTEGTLDGLIYDFEQIDHMPPKDSDKPQAQKTAEELYADSLQEIQGLDFGFTNDPTARVQIYADPKRKHAYIRERCYRTHMQNRHIIEDLKEDGVGRRVEIFADCAEPKSIQDIIDGGFNVTACDKDAPVKSDKLKFQIQWMQGWKFFVTKDSLNLIEELRNYTWAKDKDGNLLNQPIDKFNHCFTGDTLIETENGLKRIDSIKVGERVWTSGGLKSVERLWKNGYKKICNITLFFANFEVRMSVTPDHKVKAGKQWKKVSELKRGDILWVSRFSMERNIISIKERDIIPGEQGDCTGWCGNTTTERFLRDTKSTTRMGILRTMTSAILNVFHLRNILRNIVNLSLQGLHLTSLSSILQRSDHWHLNGTSQRRGESGTGCIQWGKETGLFNVPVNVVGELSSLPMQIQSSVPTIANQNGGETTTKMMKQESALYAERNSGQTDSGTQNAAVAVVLQDIEIRSEEKREVFDLQVNDIHEYFANGILVHNCLDALRYALWTKYGQNAGQGQYSILYNRKGHGRNSHH